MIQIAHDGIEIGHHILVAIGVYLTNTFLENLQSLIVLLLLIMGNSPIIIEFQSLGHIFHGRCTQTNDFIKIFFRNSKTQQLQTGRFVFRININYLLKNRLCLFVHPFGQKILGSQHGHICILLLLSQHGIEKTHNLSAILITSLRTHDELAHDIHLRSGFHLLIQKQRIKLQPIKAILTGLIIIGGHGKHRRSISWLSRQDLLESGIRFLFLAILQIHIAQHGEVAHLVRIFLGQVFYFSKSMFNVIHRQIHTELLHTDLFRFTIQLFQSVERMNDFLIILGTIIEIDQSHQRFQSGRELLNHFFYYGNSFFRFPFTLIISGQCFLIPIIARLSLHRLPQERLTLICLSQIHMEFTQLV